MIDKRQAESAGARERIDGYLKRGDLAARSPRVVPLTGDASDRRYFRVLMPDAPSVVLSLYADAFDYESLPFVNVAELLSRRCRCRSRRSSATPTTSASSRSRISATSRCRRTSAPRPPSEHAALYREAVALIATLQRRGAELASPDYLPYGIAFDVEKLTWELDFFIKHFIEAYRGVVMTPPKRAPRCSEEFAVIDPAARRRAARALPPRLPQPQPDAARRPALHHRLPGRAHGPGHLRPGVAAARFLRRPAGADGQRAARLFPGPQGRSAAARARSAAGST